MTAANINRELKGLQVGMQAVGVEDGILICESVQKGVEVPSWCHVNEAWQWGVEVSDMLKKK